LSVRLVLFINCTSSNVIKFLPVRVQECLIMKNF
jgi:hypothetical protein